jgi:DNA helicase-2/ATP-dependent DNA helicase PcrA
MEFAYLISEWRELLPRVRPAQLMEKVVRESGLAAYYTKEPRRMENLRELYRTALSHDDLRLSPMQALESFTNFAALARNIDRLDLEGKVVCITVHQAKGLEFDVVLLAGLSEWDFPNYGAVKDGRELEERRLFYVAVTRAKERLFVSYFRHKSGKPRSESPYLRFLRAPSPSTMRAGAP